MWVSRREHLRQTAISKAHGSWLKIPYLRWLIMGLICLVACINYLDRLTISVLAPVIRQNLQLSNLEYAAVGTFFLLGYTLSQGLSGKLYDQIGIRLGFVCSVVVWSIAAMLHATARGIVSLSCFRFMLGLGEAGNWPGAAKTAAEWLPVQERALGLAVFNFGIGLGSIVAPPLIVWLQFRYGWQATFIVTGSLGFAWLVLWLVFYRPPEEHPWLTSRERETILGSKDQTQRESSIPWLQLLRYRQVWAIVLGRTLTDPVWWLYILWLPEYLNKTRGFSLTEIGRFAWIPFVAADLGSLTGGFTSGFLIRRGWTVDRARKTVMILAAALMPAGIVAVRTSSSFAALALIGLVLFGFQAWVVNLQTMPSDIFPDRVVGAVAGLAGVGSGLSNMLFILATGWTVDHFSYTPVLTVAGFLGPLGAFVLFTLCRKIERAPCHMPN